MVDSNRWWGLSRNARIEEEKKETVREQPPQWFGVSRNARIDQVPVAREEPRVQPKQATPPKQESRTYFGKKDTLGKMANKILSPSALRAIPTVQPTKRRMDPRDVNYTHRKWLGRR